MKKISLSIVTLLATLLFFSSLAYSADTLIANTDFSDPATVATVKAPQQVDVETSFVNVISDLMDSDVGYQLNESAAISLVYCPFDIEQNDAQADQPTSDIYVGLKFTF
jgi:hypothetical protein